MKFYTLTCFFMLSCCILADVSRSDLGKAPITYTQQEKRFLEDGLTLIKVQSTVYNTAEAFEKHLTEKKLSSSMATLYINELEKLDKYYFFELDSGVSRKWFNSMMQFARALQNALDKLYYMEMNHKTNTPEYKQWQNYYKKTAKDFVAWSQKPQKVSSAKTRALAKEKKAVIDYLQEKGDLEKKNKKK